MKNNYLLFAALFFSLGTVAQIVNIPDANFKARLLLASTNNSIARNNNNAAIKIDSNNDGEIQASEALAVYQLNVNSYNLPATSRISDMTGLGAFQNLRILKCAQNNLTQIDLHDLVLLEQFEGHYNAFTSLDISGLPNLVRLLVPYNQITALTQNGNVSLEDIWISDNLMTSMDLSVFPALQWISCSSNHIASLNFTGLLNIDEIECDNNQLTSINLNGLSTLRLLDFSGNQITTIDLSNLNTLWSLNCSNNPITNLNVNGRISLNVLNVSGTLITSADCSQAPVTQLFAMSCPNLQTVNVRNGAISFSDPDLLFYAFRIWDNPQLVSICTDDGEQNQLALQPYTYNTSGNVVVYNGANCDVPVAVNMGVGDFNKPQVALYPNPTSSILNISISDNTPVSRARITNMLGQSVMVRESATLDVSSLAAGTYLITIETETGKQTQRFLKL